MERRIGVRMKLDMYRAESGGGSLADCPIRGVIDGISGRWSTLLLMALAERPYRFGELRRLVPDISQRMLTQTLHELQRDGYVSRTVLPSRPPGVEYGLTPLGESLFTALEHLIFWAETNHEAVRNARSGFDSGLG